MSLLFHVDRQRTCTGYCHCSLIALFRARVKFAVMQAKQRRKETPQDTWKHIVVRQLPIWKGRHTRVPSNTNSGVHTLLPTWASAYHVSHVAFCKKIFYGNFYSFLTVGLSDRTDALEQNRILQFNLMAGNPTFRAWFHCKRARPV